jgi:hypothetical protein
LHMKIMELDIVIVTATLLLSFLGISYTRYTVRKRSFYKQINRKLEDLTAKRDEFRELALMHG